MTGSCDLTLLVQNNDEAQTNSVMTHGFALNEKRKRRKWSAGIALRPAGVQKTFTQLIRHYYSPFVTLTVHINYHYAVSQSNYPQVNKSVVRAVTFDHNSSSFKANRFAVVHMAVGKHFYIFFYVYCYAD